MLNTGVQQNSKAKLQNQAQQYITIYLKGFGTLMTIENYTYELNS